VRGALETFYPVTFVRASRLLGREVRFRGIRLAVVVDLLVDIPSRRALGYHVVCGDDGRRFLPLAASDLADGAIDVGSALVLLDDPFYRDRAASFAALRGSAVERGSRKVGVLRDVGFDDAGTIATAIVDTGGGVVEIPLDPDVALRGGEALRPAV